MDNKKESENSVDVQSEIEVINGKEYKPWQFRPGQSGNPNGKPKGAGTDPLKELATIIASHKIKITKAKQKRLGLSTDKLTLLEHIMIDWASSLNSTKQDLFMQRFAGKVPNVNLNSNQNSNFDFMKHADKFTDAELEAIKNGADPLDILFSKLPNVGE